MGMTKKIGMEIKEEIKYWNAEDIIMWIQNWIKWILLTDFYSG